jgi:hypothetical protein
MIDYLTLARMGLGLVDQVMDAQLNRFSFGFADAMETLLNIIVPVLFSQMEMDRITRTPLALGNVLSNTSSSNIT